MLLAVNYLHQHKISARSISPEHFLFAQKSEDSVIKLIGISKASFCRDNHKLTEMCGVPFYTAPEVFKEEYGIECDVWSCGVILFVMLAGYPPFYGSNESEIIKHIL